MEPTWRLLGVRGGGGASDSQEIPGDRYLGSLGWASLTVRQLCRARQLTQPCFPGSRPAGEEEAGGPERPGDV